MNIEIKPGAALDDASQIESIVSTIEQTMAELNHVMDRTIPAGIETDWSEEVKQHWMHYYAGDIPTAMEAMKASAKNLKVAVDEAVAYSKESR